MRKRKNLVAALAYWKLRYRLSFRIRSGCGKISNHSEPVKMSAVCGSVTCPKCRRKRTSYVMIVPRFGN